MWQVLPDRANGGASIEQGQLEVMVRCRVVVVVVVVDQCSRSSLTDRASQVHRRILHDDHRGVGEPLNETGTSGLGLVVTGAQCVLCPCH